MIKNKAYVIIGPQGSGKGTQAKLLAKNHEFEVLTMGNLLKTEAKKDTPLAAEIKEYVMKGNLVPNKATFKVLEGWLKTIPNEKLILFDGFPRSMEQVEELEKLVDIVQVIYLQLPYEVSIKRIAGRRICDNGHQYHVVAMQPKKEGVCDHDGLSLHRRVDDTEDAIIQRLKIFEEATGLVISYYDKQGKVININGDASIESVSKDVEDKVFGNESEK